MIILDNFSLYTLHFPLLYTPSVQFRHGLAILGFLTLLPLSAAAKEVTVWDFRDSRVPGEWNIRNIASATATKDGIRLRTDAEGLLWRGIPDGKDIDAVTFVVTSDKDIDVNLLWHVPGRDGLLSGLRFSLPAGTEPATVSAAPEGFPLWNPSTDAIGISLPAGSDIVVESIVLEHWNAGEKPINAMKSFWTPDEFRPYSINFLWGPLLAVTPYGREQLFDRLPPVAHSAVRIFLGLLALGALAGICTAFFARGNERAVRWALKSFAVLTLALWLLFDLRMGGEILGYAATDLRTHVLPPTGEKTLRTHGPFYDVAAQALPELRKESRYALVTENESPVYSNLRYMSYPSLPIRPGGDTKGVDLLFVYERPDIRVDEGKLMNDDGSVISQNGEVIAWFGSGTFLYRSASPSAR